MTKNFSTVRRLHNRRQHAAPSSGGTAKQTEQSTTDEAASSSSTVIGQRFPPIGDRREKLFQSVSGVSSSDDSDVDRDWAPNLSTVFKVLASLRMSAAIWSPISDCDEVYNYWEPLHLFLYGTPAFQTWEYSPDYAIRSYAYVFLHALAARPFQALLPHTKVTTFFFVRCFLGFIGALTELYLYRSVCRRWGNAVGRLYIVLSAFASGMFVSQCALLPSSFSMTLNALALAFWLDEKWYGAVVATAASALVGWPFAAVLGLPVVLETLVSRPQRILRFVGAALLSGGLICLLLFAFDSHFYGRWVLAPLNIVLYNVLGSGGGPDLYGVAPVSYYLLNLALNWNLAAPLALVTVPATACALYMDGSGRKSKGSTWIGRLAPVLYMQASLWLWLAIFFSQPHKEERFLFPIYPLIALSAALTLHSVYRTMRATHALSSVANWFQSVIQPLCILVFVLVSLSRSAALFRHYHAPFDTYMALNERLVANSKAGLLASDVRVCVGKEWYRFPSSFFVPNRLNATTVRLEFIRSEFAGILPKHFPHLDSVGTAHGDLGAIAQLTRLVPTHMNDMNREEPSRYVPLSSCDYLVDLETPSSSALEPNYATASEEWTVADAQRFLLAAHSSQLARAFFLPFLSERYCRFGRYLLLERTAKTHTPDGHESESLLR